MRWLNFIKQALGLKSKLKMPERKYDPEPEVKEPDKTYEFENLTAIRKLLEETNKPETKWVAIKEPQLDLKDTVTVSDIERKILAYLKLLFHDYPSYSCFTFQCQFEVKANNAKDLQTTCVNMVNSMEAKCREHGRRPKELIIAQQDDKLVFNLFV